MVQTVNVKGFITADLQRELRKQIQNPTPPEATTMRNPHRFKTPDHSWLDCKEEPTFHLLFGGYPAPLSWAIPTRFFDNDIRTAKPVSNRRINPKIPISDLRTGLCA